jgi:hypothetical protein
VLVSRFHLSGPQVLYVVPLQSFANAVDAVSIESDGGARKSSDVAKSAFMSTDPVLVGGARKSSAAAKTSIGLTRVLRYLLGSADTGPMANRMADKLKLVKMPTRTAAIFDLFVNCII